MNAVPASGGRGNERHELYGNWVVDTFTADGVEHPPLATDPVRWLNVAASPRHIAIWMVSGERDPQVTAKRGAYPWKIDAEHHTVTLTIDADKKLEETWQYSRPAPDRLVIDAVHLGKTLHVVLRAVPDPLLVTRGFHWINERPYSR